MNKTPVLLEENMEKKDFENLKAGIQEVIEIERGEREPAKCYTRTKKEKRFAITCLCGHAKVEYIMSYGKFDVGDDEDSIFVEFWVPSFYANQRDGFWYMWKERIKAAWAMLQGKKFHLEEIIIDDPDDIKRFKEWVNEL